MGLEKKEGDMGISLIYNHYDLNRRRKDGLAIETTGRTQTVLLDH